MPCSSPKWWYMCSDSSLCSLSPVFSLRSYNLVLRFRQVSFRTSTIWHCRWELLDESLRQITKTVSDFWSKVQLSELFRIYIFPQILVIFRRSCNSYFLYTSSAVKVGILIARCLMLSRILCTPDRHLKSYYCVQL